MSVRGLPQSIRTGNATKRFYKEWKYERGVSCGKKRVGAGLLVQ